jgi:hypothetical protein
MKPEEAILNFEAVNIMKVKIIYLFIQEVLLT